MRNPARLPCRAPMMTAHRRTESTVPSVLHRMTRSFPGSETRMQFEGAEDSEGSHEESIASQSRFLVRLRRPGSGAADLVCPYSLAGAGPAAGCPGGRFCPRLH